MPESSAGQQRVRHAIRSALAGDFGDGQATLAHVYTPQAHHRALRLDAALVVGGRGTGKTFWTSALRDETIRRSLGSVNRDLAVTDVQVGHAETPNSDVFPDAATFVQLLDQGFSAYDVWRTVVHGLVASPDARLRYDRGSSWSSRVENVRSAPEELSRDVEDAQRRRAESGRHSLVVFDALDRVATDWGVADRVARDLLRTALWIRSFRNLHVKVFLREDQYERTIYNFPDASKLKSTAARLTWGREDLHGLLWTRLINADGEDGEVLRDLARSSHDGEVLRQVDEVWRLTVVMEARLRDLFARLAGTKMGTNQRRGNPYTWIVNHLADGKGAASPRSLLRALEEAAADSLARYGDGAFPFALHYESIKRGVGRASENRVAELGEDYPWVAPIVGELKGTKVPLDESAVIETLDREHAKEPSDALAAVSGSFLPPEHVDEGWPGIIEDLLNIGVLTRRTDGRIDMPDLYRIGFEVRRKGGVAPQK